MGWQERFIRARRNRHKSEMQLAVQQLLLQGDGGVTTYGIITPNLLPYDCSEYTLLANTVCNVKNQNVSFTKPGPGTEPQAAAQWPNLVPGTTYTCNYTVTGITGGQQTQVSIGGPAFVQIETEPGNYTLTAQAANTNLNFTIEAGVTATISNIVLFESD